MMLLAAGVSGACNVLGSFPNLCAFVHLYMYCLVYTRLNAGCTPIVGSRFTSLVSGCAGINAVDAGLRGISQAQNHFSKD